MTRSSGDSLLKCVSDVHLIFSNLLPLSWSVIFVSFGQSLRFTLQTWQSADIALTNPKEKCCSQSSLSSQWHSATQRQFTTLTTHSSNSEETLVVALRRPKASCHGSACHKCWGFALCMRRSGPTPVVTNGAALVSVLGN